MPNIYWLPTMRPKYSLQNLKMCKSKMAACQTKCIFGLLLGDVESRVDSEASVSGCLSLSFYSDLGRSLCELPFEWLHFCVKSVLNSEGGMLSQG